MLDQIAFSNSESLSVALTRWLTSSFTVINPTNMLKDTLFEEIQDCHYGGHLGYKFYSNISFWEVIMSEITFYSDTLAEP